MLPEGFTDLLANIEITGFYAGFDPIKKSLRSVQLQVQTKTDWVIVQDKLKIKEGIGFAGFISDSHKSGDRNKG